MIASGGYTILLQVIIYSLCLLAAATVHDAALLIYIPQGFNILVFTIAYIVENVFPGKTLLIDIRLPHLQLRYNVLPHICGCGRCEGQHRRVGKYKPCLGYLQVIGPEVMPPLRYTMRLIHGYHAHIKLRHILLEHGCLQPLGRYIQQFVSAMHGIV